MRNDARKDGMKMRSKDLKKPFESRKTDFGPLRASKIRRLSDDIQVGIPESEAHQSER